MDLLDTPYVEVIVVDARGENPADPGARIRVGPSGLIEGTIGGGKVEAKAIKEAQAMIVARTLTAFHTWNLQKDVGMTCGGEMRFFFQLRDTNLWRIALFGAGHVAQAVARLLTTLECHVTCIDPRLEWTERLPEHARLAVRQVETPSQEVASFNNRTYFVVMTQGHATDVPILKEIFERFPDAPFVGAIGSPVKAITMRKELKSLGVSDDGLAKLRCPIGLPIGTNAPTEIAVSVVAQLLMVRDGQSFSDKQWQTLIQSQGES